MPSFDYRAAVRPFAISAFDSSKPPATKWKLETRA